MLIDINGASAAVRKQDILTVGMVGAEAKFVFSGDVWDGLIKTAVFRQGNETKDVMMVDDTVTIPREVLQLPGIPVSVGVYGESKDKTIVVPTVWTKTAPVQAGADPSKDYSYPPTPDLSNQAYNAAVAAVADAQAAVTAARAAVTDIEQKAENGEFDGPAGPQGPAYELTSEDKAELVAAVIAQLPVYDGEAVDA